MNNMIYEIEKILQRHKDKDLNNKLIFNSLVDELNILYTTYNNSNLNIIFTPNQCCPVCNGTGKMYTNIIILNEDCKVCKGSGIIPMYITKYT